MTKLLSKQPQHRFQSAAHLRDALAAYLAHRQRPLAVARPARISLPKTQLRNRRWLVGLCVVSLIVSGCIFYFTNFGRRTHSAEPSGAGQASLPESESHPQNTPKPTINFQLQPLNQIDERLQQVDQQIREMSRPDTKSDPADLWSQRVQDIENELQKLQQHTSPW